MKGHGHRAGLKQFLQAHQATGFVRQDKGRHRLARLRRIPACAGGIEALDEPVDRRRVRRKMLAHRLRIERETLVEGSIHLAALREKRAKFGERGGRHLVFYLSVQSIRKSLRRAAR